MPLFNQILEDIKSSMKQGEKEKLLCLRGLHSDIKNISINQKIEISDAVVIQCLAKNIKQRKVAIEMFTEGKREDLVQQNQQEIAWINTYLPSSLAKEDLTNISKKIIMELGVSSKKDMGLVMKKVKLQLDGQLFDGKELSQIVAQQLS